MLLSLNNTSLIYSQLSAFPLLLQEANDAQDQNNSHDCAWDGDDIASNPVIRFTNHSGIETDFINPYKGNMLSVKLNNNWQPPKSGLI